MRKGAIGILSLFIVAAVCLPAHADEDDGKIIASEAVKNKWPDGTVRMILTIFTDGSTKVTQYFQNGNLSVEIRTNKALRQHGLFRQWHENGEPAQEGYWDNGVRIGTWTSWLDNGQPLSRTEYQQGDVAEECRWSVLTRSWYVVKR